MSQASQIDGSNPPPTAARLRAVGSFTVLELLIVISIIATLAALLTPGLKAARDQANATACMSNLRQIGIAMTLYGDERGTYPWGYTNTTDWSYSIQGYLQKLSGLTYVSGSDSRSPVIQCPSRTYRPTNIVNCYGSHDRLLGNAFGAPYNTTPPYPRSFPFTERPFDVWMIADAAQDAATIGGESQATIWNMQPDIGEDYDSATGDDIVTNVGDNIDDPGSLGQIRWRHGGNTRANFLFVDGHVESIQKTNLRERHLKITGP